MDFVDHFRGDESDFDYGWEERWIRDEGYSKIVPPAIKAALAACKLKGSDITHFIMPSLMPAVPKQMAKFAGIELHLIGSLQLQPHPEVCGRNANVELDSIMRENQS